MLGATIRFTGLFVDRNHGGNPAEALRSLGPFALPPGRCFPCARFMNVLRRLWLGEVPLSEAFWNWAVIGGLIVNLSTSFLSLVLITLGHPISALIIGHGIAAPYNLIASVGVWRATLPR